MNTARIVRIALVPAIVLLACQNAAFGQPKQTSTQHFVIIYEGISEKTVEFVNMARLARSRKSKPSRSVSGQGRAPPSLR